MAKPKDALHQPPREAASYDDFLGRFVDAVQVGRAGVRDLRAAWIKGCPSDWQERFSADLGEIETLLADGAMVTDAA